MAARFDPAVTVIKQVKQFDLDYTDYSTSQIRVCIENGKEFVVFSKCPTAHGYIVARDNKWSEPKYKEYVMPGFIWKKMVAIVPWVNFHLEQFRYVDHEANKAGTFTDYAELTYNGNDMWAQKVRITTVSQRLYVALSNFWRPGGSTVLKPTSKNFFIRESVWPELEKMMPKITEALEAAAIGV